MKTWLRVLLILAIGLAVPAIYAFVELRSVDVEQLSDDLCVLRGAGGNTAVLRTAAGAAVVDTKTLPMQGRRIRETARELTGMDTVPLHMDREFVITRAWQEATGNFERLN